MGLEAKFRESKCWRGRKWSRKIQSARFDGVKRAPFPTSGRSIVGFSVDLTASNLASVCLGPIVWLLFSSKEPAPSVEPPLLYKLSCRVDSVVSTR